MMPAPVAPTPEAAAAAAAEADRRAIFGEDDDDDSDMDDDDDDAFDEDAGGTMRPEDDLNSSASSSDEETPRNGRGALQPVPIAPFPPSVVHHYPGGMFDTVPDAKRVRVDGGVATPVMVGSSSEDRHRSLESIEDSRRLFQRLWTDEDEMIILQGFYDFTSQRGTTHHAHQHDTGPFYEQIRSRLQLDFSKNQLVEKLRRLKKKYRNVVSKMAAGKGFAFKSPHDQATFEISRKIWSGSVVRTGGGGFGGGCGQVSGGGYNEDAAEPVSMAAPRGGRRRVRKRSASEAMIGVQPTGMPAAAGGTSAAAALVPVIPATAPVSVIPVEVKAVPVEIRSVIPALPTTSAAVAVQVEATCSPMTSPLPPAASPVTPAATVIAVPPTTAATPTPTPTTTTLTTKSNNNTTNMLEETVKSCLSPLFKELLHCAMAGPLTTAFGGGAGGGNVAISQALMPLGFTSNVPFPKEADPDGRWKKQQIRELEVFSQRLDLVQEQIKAVLDDLRSS